jgi:hypothetical protein
MIQLDFTAESTGDAVAVQAYAKNLNRVPAKFVQATFPQFPGPGQTHKLLQAL